MNRDILIDLHPLEVVGGGLGEEEAEKAEGFDFEEGEELENAAPEFGRHTI